MAKVELRKPCDNGMALEREDKIMQLVMKRERLTPTELPLLRDLFASFKINARLVTETEESSLITRYSLRHVTLTPGNTARDRRKAGFFAAPIAILFGVFIYLPL